MGTFRPGCAITHITHRDRRAERPSLLVDTGSEYTWLPGDVLQGLGIDREKKDLEFVMANGGRITRSVGFAILHVEDRFTVDEVVFAEQGDLELLGARTLKGLNLTIDPRAKKLVAAGPFPVARLESLPAPWFHHPDLQRIARGMDRPMETPIDHLPETGFAVG